MPKQKEEIELPHVDSREVLHREYSESKFIIENSHSVSESSHHDPHDFLFEHEDARIPRAHRVYPPELVMSQEQAREQKEKLQTLEEQYREYSYHIQLLMLLTGKRFIYDKSLFLAYKQEVLQSNWLIIEEFDALIHNPGFQHFPSHCFTEFYHQYKLISLEEWIKEKIKSLKSDLKQSFECKAKDFYLMDSKKCLELFKYCYDLHKEDQDREFLNEVAYKLFVTAITAKNRVNIQNTLFLLQLNVFFKTPIIFVACLELLSQAIKDFVAPYHDEKEEKIDVNDVNLWCEVLDHFSISAPTVLKRECISLFEAKELIADSLASLNKVKTKFKLDLEVLSAIEKRNSLVSKIKVTDDVVESMSQAFKNPNPKYAKFYFDSTNHERNLLKYDYDNQLSKISKDVTSDMRQSCLVYSVGSQKYMRKMLDNIHLALESKDLTSVDQVCIILQELMSCHFLLRHGGVSSALYKLFKPNGDFFDKSNAAAKFLHKTFDKILSKLSPLLVDRYGADARYEEKISFEEDYRALSEIRIPERMQKYLEKDRFILRELNAMLSLRM